MPRRIPRLVIPAAILWLAGLAAYPLLESTEGRYASVAWTMAHGGSWLEPAFNGIPLFTKPPLAYWAGALALKALPDAAWVVRLPASLALLSCALLTRRLALIAGLDPRRAGRAALIAALSPLALVQGHMTTGDIFLWTGILLAFVGLLDSAPGRWRRAAVVGSGLAIGFLAKGHMVLFWVILPLAGWAVQRGGDSRPLRRLAHPAIWLVFAVLALPWFGVVLHRHPELLPYWLGSETSDRFLSTAHGRSEPWWYFLPQVPILLLPWLPEAWRGVRRRVSRPGFHLLLAVWIILPLVIFSISGSKRPNYLLPLVTPLALLAAIGWPDRATAGLRWRTGIWTIIALAWPFAIGLAHLGPPTHDLVAAAAESPGGLMAFGSQPSSLEFYAGGEVPVIGIRRPSPLNNDGPQGRSDDATLARAHLARGGWILLRSDHLPDLRALADSSLTVMFQQGRYALAARSPNSIAPMANENPSHN